MFFRQRAAENATLSYLFGCTGIGLIKGGGAPSSKAEM